MSRGQEERNKMKKKEQMTMSGKSVFPLNPSPWCHSPTASLPIKALIKTDKVSPNEERAVGGLYCRSLSITLPEEIGEGRAKGYGNGTQSRGAQITVRLLILCSKASHKLPEKLDHV